MNLLKCCLFIHAYVRLFTLQRLSTKPIISMLKTSDFKAAWYLANPHLQTIWPYVFRPRRYPPYKMERLELPDGDFVDLLWTTPSGKQPIVVLLHGLEGSYQSHYMSGLLRSLHDSGFRCVVMHFRGCSGEPNRLDRAYHSGETGDLAYLIKTVKQREPHTPVFAVGVSVGGNVLLKWLGETGADNPLVAAAAISVPFQLNLAVARMEQGFGRVYQRYLLRSLQRNTQRKFASRNAPFDLKRLAKIKTLREFDDLVTAPLHGFQSAAHYYEVCSSRRYLGTIERPTLIIHAKDDPFMTPQVIPEPHELSKSTILELSERGGHVGFIANQRFKLAFTVEARIKTFFRKQLSEAELDR